MTDPTDPEAAVLELTAPGDCYCTWLTADEIARREAVAASVTESRTEAVRLLRLAEARAASEPSLLVHIALAWKEIARLQ